MYKHFFALLGILIPLSLFSQNKFTLSGYIKDSVTGEALIAANVYLTEAGAGVVSNTYGYYSITVAQGKYNVRFSYVGYDDKFLVIDMNQNKNLTIELAPKQKLLQEARVSSQKANENIESTEVGTVRLSIGTIQKLPALLGEVDLVKSVQLLPGVSTVGEGASGFNVRGGSIDQNLVLIDDAPVFNSSHLFGFFSVFNPDAVKDVKLIKGGIPSPYGGRLSSILDVKMKEGNAKKLSGSGGLGLIFSRFALEGPLKKDKSSFIIAGRRSYIDVLSKPFLPDNLSSSQFYFYDLTAKANYTINKKNKIFLSGYLGRDAFSASGIFGFDWGNQTATFRWNKLFSNRLFLNTTAYYSKYDYRLRFGGGDDGGFDWTSNIINYSIKPEFTYYLRPDVTMNFGMQSIFYTFKPGTAITTFGGSRVETILDFKYALENGVYVDFEHKVNAKLNLRYGIRLSHFEYLANDKVYVYNDTTPNVRKPLQRVDSYEKYASVARYINPEPRINASYILNEKSSIKGGYNRMTQYLHLISNTAASVPLDVWTPSTNNIPGQIADQLSFGYFRNFKENKYETSVEIYYKDLQNQIDYIDGADLLLNELLEGELLTGKGRAYGAEFYVKKNTGKLTGWISYTLARSERLVEGINRNNWFPTRFDRAHNFNLVGIYEINEKFTFSSNFIFSTGTPATFPTTKYYFQGFQLPHNALDSRNNFRIPPFHRLDVSLTIEGKKRKKWESNWVISVYNVYGRKNPFSIYFQPNPSNVNQTQAIRFAVLGAPVPAVTYNFKF